ncbi:Methyl-CpG-binding domain protein [Operophtera brumata]|uniref:Methyl-CpG-binding domain protein n=1 Tax=Operophtera brumata TaxID=104452 RepID=A0A0L7LFT3_OPEBR|nr:Methyl-CpG-binding domain protein [Operophtera brumata]
MYLPTPAAVSDTVRRPAMVASKPYQAASGAELTKLCNHKRKLLATLQARAQSPQTPPPQNNEPKKGIHTIDN